MRVISALGLNGVRLGVGIPGMRERVTQLNGTHSLTAHAELVRVSHGTSALGGTAESVA
jgi:glucose-6-phosphate-specific signal transduction histidine kinase